MVEAGTGERLPGKGGRAFGAGALARMLGMPHQPEARRGYETGEKRHRDEPAACLLRHAESCPRKREHLERSERVGQDGPAAIPVSGR